MPDTFCPIPWIFQAPKSNGDLRVCCQANNTKTAGIIRKKDGTAYNAGRDNLEDSRNADLLKIMRKNMLNGVWSDECTRCKAEEHNGEYSRRKYELDNWNFSEHDANAHTLPDGTVSEVPVQYYDFRFGNKCNLACRMCGPTDSDYWYDDWQKIRGDEFQDNGGETIVIGRDNPYNWHESESFWKQVEDNISNIRQIYFAGGEPMLIQRHYSFLEKCVNDNHAQNITLEYNTNLSTLPPRVLKLWESFKKVRIGASIDGYGDILEYQRYPAKWDKIYKNILLLDSLSANVESWFAYTVTAYNVEHIVDFIEWTINQNFTNINKTKPIITHHMAYGPHHINVKVLPHEYKQLVTAKILDFLQKMKYYKYNKELTEKLTSVIDFMNKESYEVEYGTYFIEYTSQLDKIRNQKISDVVPNLVKYIENKGDD